MDILIKNGTIINAENSIVADLLMSDGHITRIESNIKPTNEKIIDASGCLLFPGAIDPHVHLNLSTPAGFSSDDFYTGTRAALYGGTTCIIDFVTPQRGQSIFEALLLRKEEANNSMVDYKFHVSPVEWLPKTEEEIIQCFKVENVRSFKVYMAYKRSIGINDGAIFKVMKTVGQLGGIVTLHCEMGDEIEVLRNNFASLGKFSMKYHAFSRPREMEAFAVKKAIELAALTNCPIYIVHVSARESLDYIRKAQSDLLPVYAETCPQYLLLNDEWYVKDFENATPYIISPPLRKAEDNQALWHAIADGTIDSVGTDHCPFLLEQKKQGILDFRKIPNGAGGIEHRLELLFTYGVLQNRISINRFVDIVSTQPARIFGLYPQKGTISIGSDADIVIWDPAIEREISVKNHHQHCDTNIYEGFKIKGQVKHLFCKGIQVIEDTKMIAEPKGVYII